MANPSSFAKRCWSKFYQEAFRSIFSPVVVCLASGSLNIDTYRHFIAQDVHFLKAFTKACEMAENCADDAKLAISEFRKVVLKELTMHHDSFVQEWRSNESPINSATVKYTEFLLATARGDIDGLKATGNLATPFEKTKIAAYTLGAMAPCMKMYDLLAIQCNASLKPSDDGHPYKKWIEKYFSQRFQASALQTEDLLDKLSVTLTGDELKIIEKLYHQAVKLLLEFFNAQPVTQPTAVPLTKEHDPVKDHLVIFSDFDLTCTVIDSSAILAEIAKVRAQKFDQNQQEGQISCMSSSELGNKWESISKQYTDEYEKCIRSMLSSVKVEFNYEALHKALEQVSEFEKKANSRVTESGLLKGISLEEIKRAGEQLEFQDGCISFFQKIAKNENLNTSIHIISYCWCGDLIQAAFSSRGLDVDVLNIHANEFRFEESVCTGEFVGNVQSPIDKVQIFNDILQHSSNDKKKLTVYIGDTVGDLLCLLKADIGIVIGSSSSLTDVASKYGVSFVPLFPGLVMKQKEYAEGSTCIWKSQSGILYTVSCWDEIHAFILR